MLIERNVLLVDKGERYLRNRSTSEVKGQKNLLVQEQVLKIYIIIYQKGLKALFA